jgi:hypothetical protein
MCDRKLDHIARNYKQKVDVLQNEILLEKKKSLILTKKLNFLEANQLNIVETLVATRTNELTF